MNIKLNSPSKSLTYLYLSRALTLRNVALISKSVFIFWLFFYIANKSVYVKKM